MKKCKSTRNVCTLAGLILAAILSGSAQAQTEAEQIPPSVAAEAQALETKFNSILAEECSSHLCTPVGCEVLSFRTLDQKQNSSLPGLDMGDEAPGQLQYKLASAKCDFTYEPMLSNDAVNSLRQRVQDKTRLSGVSLTIAGRKLSPANPGLRDAPKEAPPAALPPAPSVWAPFWNGLPNLLMVGAVTIGLLLLIWGFRRLGKPKAKALAAATPIEAAPEETSAAPSALTLMNKKETLLETLVSHPDLATSALEPLAKEGLSSGSVDDLCRVLTHFGPLPLKGLSQKSEYRDLFASVHQQFAERANDDSDSELWNFLLKTERLVALARLGRPEGSLQDEFAFMQELAPDEFLNLTRGLKPEELMTVLSFVPQHLRTRLLQTRDERFLESYAQFVVQNPRISEQTVRRIASSLKEHFVSDYAGIKNVSQGQLPLVEQLLNSLNPTGRQKLVVQLKAQNPQLFERLMSEVLLEKAMVGVPTSALNDLFLTLTPEEAGAYLIGHPDRAAIMSRLKGPLAQSLETRLRTRYGFGRSTENLDFVEKEDPLAQTARLKINAALKQKTASGELSLRRLNEAVMDAV